jgi:hypothetical protein
VRLRRFALICMLGLFLFTTQSAVAENTESDWADDHSFENSETPWFLTNPISSFGPMNWETAERFVKSFEGQRGVEGVDDAVNSMNLRFGIRGDSRIFVSSIVPALASVFDFFSVEDLLPRLPRPVFLALVGLVSRKIRVEDLNPGKEVAKEYRRLMQVLGKTELDLVKRVKACLHADELALLLRLQFHFFSSTPETILTETCTSASLSALDSKKLLQGFSPPQIFALVYLMPLHQIQAVISQLANTQDGTIFRHYSDEVAALARAANLKAIRIHGHGGFHLGSPAMAKVFGDGASKLGFGFYTLLTGLGLHFFVEGDFIYKIIASTVIGGSLRAVTRPLLLHHARGVRQRRATSIREGAAHLTEKIWAPLWPCPQELLRIIPRR